jgi:hypothetical protein
MTTVKARKGSNVVEEEEESTKESKASLFSDVLLFL